MTNDNDGGPARDAASGIPEHLRKRVDDAASAAGFEPNNAKAEPTRSRAKPKPESRQGKGGGPKNAAGKKRSSQNALKHGIHAMHPVALAEFESIDEWEEFYDGFRDYLKPDGPPEEDLVYQIAANRWRARRVVHAETAEINEQVWKTAADLSFADIYKNSLTKEHPAGDVPDPDATRVLIHQQSRVVRYSSPLERFVRYEAHLHRLFIQLLNQLALLQARRLGRPTAYVRFHHSSDVPPSRDTDRPELPETGESP